MKQKLLIPGVVALIVIGLIVAVPSFFRWRDAKRRASIPVQTREDTYKTAQWKEDARTFNTKMAHTKAIFDGATKIESFRLFGENSQKPLGKNPQFAYFGKGITGDKKLAEPLKSLLLNPKNYWRPGTSVKLCYFEPAIAFRVWKNEQFVDAIACFQCSVLVFLSNDPKVPVTGLDGWNGRFITAGDFNFIRPQLLTLTKELFPDDAEIQNLRP